MTLPRLQLDTYVERLPLKSPFRIAGYTFADVRVHIVTLTDGALRGRGEATGIYYLDDEPDKCGAAPGVDNSLIRINMSQ